MEGAVFEVLESVTQKTLHAQNFNRASSQATHVLTDLLARYVSLLATTCVRNAEHAGRRTVSIYDIVRSLDSIGVSVEELMDFAEGEGRELVRYATTTARRAEELAVLKETLAEGRRIDCDDITSLVYAEIPEGAELPNDEEEEDSSTEDTDATMPTKQINGDSSKEDARFTSPTLPLSPVSNPSSSPSRKRPRLSNWTPPEYIPDFLPPFPTSLSIDASLPPSPSPIVKSELDSECPPPPSTGTLERERERLSTPLPQQLSTATSAADYLSPVPYSLSSLSSTSESHLPDKAIIRNAQNQALQLHRRKHDTPDITPSLMGAYHYLLTNPPSRLPSTNPLRHRVALATLRQSYAYPRWTASDTLFASLAAPRPRVVAPGPTHPVAIGNKAKDEQITAVPPSTTRPLMVNDSTIVPSYQPTSRIPDISHIVLPQSSFVRASRVNPPPPLHDTSKEKLLFGTGIPAPWNSNLNTLGAPTPAPIKGKGRAKDDDEDDDELRERDRREKDSTNGLSDALLYATWDWDAHDHRLPPPTGMKRNKTIAGINVDGLLGAPNRKNSIKIGREHKAK